MGARRFEAVIHASGWVDERAIDYLAEGLRIVEVVQPDRGDLWALRSADAAVDPRADEITIALHALDGGDVRNVSWLPPDGFDVVRPAVLRLRPELAEGLAKAQDFRFRRAPLAPAREDRADVARPFTRMTGRIVCQAWDGTTKIVNPLSFVTVNVDGAGALTASAGAFELTGRFHGGVQRVGVVFSGSVGSSPSTPLQVMDDLHASRSESRDSTPTATGGDLVDLGDVELSSVDCELWRLGTVVLEDYHQAAGKSPPAKKLRIKRWSGVWDGTPYTFYEYVVLTTNFPLKAPHRDEANRRSTLFHEFGHSIRHVADGDEVHWNWDNFRWAYARFHSGCEVFNTQYAFNEGWANFWEDGRVFTLAACNTVTSGFLDWNEDLIGKRLLELSGALCTPADPGTCRRRMVEVLEKNPGAIHSLWDFEKRYCALHSAGNRFCRSSTTPRRTAPAPCPPGFHDDGATCRLDNIRAKPSYLRGVGVVPTVCGSGQQLDAGLCYPECQTGYSGVGPVCWQRCPSGFRDDGAFCAKPQPYGRGTGYAWEFGDPPFDLGNAKRRCERDHGAGRCEQNGLIFYPRCRPGFHSVGCCVCSPNCTGGMTDIGASCAKKSYGREVGTVPTRCQGGMEYDAGLCYQPCRSGFNGVGPVCWGRCPPDYADHGATCYRDPNVIVKY